MFDRTFAFLRGNWDKVDQLNTTSIATFFVDEEETDYI